MSLAPRLDLRQSQTLVMTPQLQQAIRLLACSNLEIESFVADALESNPLLDAGPLRETAAAPEPPPREEAAADRLIAQGQGEADAPLDLDPATLDRDRDTGDWGGRGGAGGPGPDGLPDAGERADAGTTLAAHLDAQIGPLARDARQAFVARYLVGQLDEAGYLAAPLAELAADLGVDPAEAEAALAVVQACEPTGIGARDLAECLALQAREADRFDPCIERLLAHLDCLARGEMERLRRLCEVDDEDLADMLAELRSYDPKPGLAFGTSDAGAVVPDVLVTGAAGRGWAIQINQATLPRLVVNRTYYLELAGACRGGQSQGWLNEKLADANWLIRALDQRQKTILKVAAEIVRQQDGFFRRGVADLRPLTLRSVADAIDMHESTVSRVTSNKYLACPRGTFELKYFFTSGVGGGGSGAGEAASSQAVKARIARLIAAEATVLSDDALVTALKDEGFDLARRTVAKYREALGIGSSVERRRQRRIGTC